jgi:hypothetical protein
MPSAFRWRTFIKPNMITGAYQASTIVSQTGDFQMAIPAKEPNFFQLSGYGIRLSYSTSGFDGKPHFSYQSAHLSKSFIGDEIRTVDTEIGTLVSVTLDLTPDFGSTSFTLLVPRVRLPASDSVNIVTDGITTLHRTSIIGPPMGQDDLYTVQRLHGTAEIVKF